MKKLFLLIVALIFVLTVSVNPALAADERYCTVKFMDGDHVLSVEEVEAGTVVEKLFGDPVKSGYVFKGWFIDENGTRAYDFSQKVMCDLVLYAGWAADGCDKFTDVRGHWAENAIGFAVEGGLFDGISETTFSPNGYMTRAMLVTVLWRLDGKPTSSIEHKFADVKAGSYYADAVAWASADGIVMGKNNQAFAPDDNVTREQIATILFRYAQQKNYDVSESADLSHYRDYDMISAYAKDCMSWADGANLLDGRTWTTMAPKDMATRAEVAAIFQRFSDKYGGL